MIKATICLLLMIFSFQAHAVRCFITGVKTNCWSEYIVSIKVINTADNSEKTTVSIPLGRSWARQEFNCEAAEILRFEAVYTPVFWVTDKGKVFYATKYWYLPKKEISDDKAWNINICFPERFSSVPMPPEIDQHCACDMREIPPVEL